MLKKLFAIFFIYVVTSIAWMVLGGNIEYRTYRSDGYLKEKVQRIWGMPQIQTPPVITYTIFNQHKEETWEDGKKKIVLKQEMITHALPLAGSEIKVALELDYRQKGLLWYSTYKVGFDSTYQLINDTGAAREFEVIFPFPTTNAIYDNFKFAVRGKPWLNQPTPKEGKVSGTVLLQPGETALLDIAYLSQGLDRWHYQFGEGVSSVKNFRLSMNTNFNEIDFPEESVSPSLKQKPDTGWLLAWQFSNLVTGVNIGMTMPQKLQPGPLAGEISFFAPISLFFFILVLLVIGLIKKVDIHPMHFFFLSAAFFAFHLLLAYLADQMSIHTAFLISAVVSLVLVISYLSVIFGNRFAFIEAGIAQLVYLVLFSYAFFFKGLTGLAITIGAILTLFVMMQLTAKINWSEVFGKNKSAKPFD